MKQYKMMQPRNVESGSVLVIVACLLTMLFAFSALAVDMGFRYTKARTLQAVADAAVTAGMPSMVSGNTTTAYNKARDMAQANGYTGSQVAIDSTSVSGQLKVTTMMSAPSFFSALFSGRGTRLVSSTAIGRVTGSTGPALLALGNCSSSPLTINGNGKLTIQGDIEANSNINFSTGGGTLPQTDSGSVQSACGSPTITSGAITYTGAGILPPATSSFSDPFNADNTTLLGTYCTGGTSLSVSRDIQYTDWTETDVINNVWTLNPGVYCTSGDLTLSGPGTTFIANNVTLVAMGHVNIGATGLNGNILTAHTGFPSNLAVYAGASGGGPAINLGSNQLTVNGSVYAPAGLANLSGQTGMVINGSVVAQTVAVSIGTAADDWTFNPNGASGTTNWRMYQ